MYLLVEPGYELQEEELAELHKETVPPPRQTDKVRREGGRGGHEAMGLAGSVLSLGPLLPRVRKGYSPVGEGSSPSAVEVNLLVSLLLRELTRSHPWA